MTTTLDKPSAAPPRPGPGGAIRFVPIRADLMPLEVLSKRQTEVVRKQVTLALVVVAGLLLAWFGLSWLQTSSARGDLSDAQTRRTALQNQQKQFAPLVTAQTEAQAIQAKLQTLMVGDLSWKELLTKLRGAAPAGLTLTTVTGSVTTPSSTTAPTTAVTAAGVGQLTLTGSAHSKNSVAAYSDRLATVPGLAAPLITNVTTTNSSVTFSMTVAITAAALGGRYASSPTLQTGGK